jgi:hypothetical protein
MPLKEDVLVPLLRAALLAAVRDLRQVTPALVTRMVYRPTANGWGGVTFPCPGYHSREVWDAISNIWNSEESAALTEYIWERGALKKELSIDGDAVPGKTGWARFVWGDLVHGPLLHLLEVALIDELTETGEYTPWRIRENEVLLASQEVARSLCRSGRHVRATCPIIGFHLEGDVDRLQLEPGISLCKMTDDRKRMLLSRFESEFVNEDMSSWASQVLFETDTVLPWGDDDQVGSFNARALDRLKWSAMITLATSSPCEEGPVILRGPAGWRGRTIRRGVVVGGNRKLPYFPITGEVSKDLTAHIEAFKRAEAVAPELAQALWHFGRACNAALARDIVLDSTIGLELLLVPDPGESTYKLSVHGLAILGPTVGGGVSGELVEIYRLRSEAAHGSSTIERKFKELAPRARQLLAMALWAVAERINDGTLDVSATKGDVGKAVKAFVLKKLGEAVQQGVGGTQNS